jgi:hypothetical protein
MQLPADAFWAAFAVCTAFLVAAAIVMVIALWRDPNWSLAATLSEESSPVVSPRAPAGSAPAPQMVGSASRMIAAFGLMVLAVMILGIGYGIMWSLFTKGEIPNLSGIGPYLLGGSALFAPYAFNQIKEAFKP